MCDQYVKQSNCEKANLYQLPYHNMLLLTNCEVHTGNIRTEVLKYGLNEMRSLRKAEVRIFSRMDRTNWSIRALLYSHKQRAKTEAFSLNSVLNIFVSSLNAAVGREIFPVPISQI